MKNEMRTTLNRIYPKFRLDKSMAARPGFEPGSKESKSLVLPLHNRASKQWNNNKL